MKSGFLRGLLASGALVLGTAMYFPPSSTQSDFTLVCRPSAGDSVDATAAINACLDSFRASLATSSAGVLRIASGVYKTTGPLNFSGIRTQGATIDARGVTIDPQMTSGVAVDGTFSRWLTVEGLTIATSGSFHPDWGFVIGRKDTQAADDNRIVGLTVTGTYNGGACYNRASETTLWEKPKCWNASATGYNLVEDGYNHFQVASTFQTVTLAVDTAVSFNENQFVSPDFRNSGGGPGIWLGSTNRHRFEACYEGNSGGTATAAVTLYNVSGQNTNRSLYFDCHIETTTVGHVFQMAGSNTTPVIYGLRYTDQNPQASADIFSLGSETSATIHDVDLHLGALQSGAVLVDTPASWSLDGRVFMATATGQNLASFAGTRNIGGTVAPGVFCAASPSASTTSSSEANMATCTLPLGVTLPNSVVHYRAVFSVTSPTAAVKTATLRYSTSSAIVTGGLLLKQIASTTSSQKTLVLEGAMYFNGSTAAQMTEDALIAGVSTLWSSGSLPATGAFDTSAGTGAATFFSINGTANGDTLVLRSYEFWIDS